jgi:hypothetical protein
MTPQESVREKFASIQPRLQALTAQLTALQGRTDDKHNLRLTAARLFQESMGILMEAVAFDLEIIAAKAHPAYDLENDLSYLSYLKSLSQMIASAEMILKSGMLFIGFSGPQEVMATVQASLATQKAKTSAFTVPGPSTPQ